MTLPPRWWAPDRATVVPDAVVLALLDPDGDDAAGDLGATLLGVHRAGAAACEAVAKGALPSEGGLSQALASSQQAIRDRFLSAVAKSADSVYAQVLVDEVLADADIAALDLYRSCVAKGVAPSQAASRAGMVYGVPNRHLGRYAAAASDPKSNPVMLSDLADRTLLGFVSKLVDVETEDTKVEISKAPGGAAAQWDPNEHPRSKETGEFVPVADRADALRRRVTQQETMSPLDRLRARLGIGRGPERIGDEVFEQAPQQRETRTAQPRQRREQRVTRERRQPQAVERSPQPAAIEATRSAAERTRSKGTAVRTRQQSAAQRKRIEQFNAGTNAAVLMPYTGNVVPPPNNLLSRLSDDGGPYDEHYEPMTFMLPQAAALQLTRGMVGGGDARMFRVGHLIESAGKPITLTGSSSQVEHQSTMAQAVVQAHEDLDMDFAAPIVKTIRLGDEDDSGPILDFERQRMTGGDAEEDQHVWIAASYESPDQDFMVYMQPSADADDDPHDRPIPTVVEYRLTRSAARMRDDGSPKYPDWKLDPNQVYRVSTSQPEVFWSNEHQARVLVYYVDPLRDEEVGAYLPGGFEFEKALDPAEAAAFERRVRRDDEGRFARTSSPSTPAVGATVESLARRVRQRRPQAEDEAVETPVRVTRNANRVTRERRERRVRREPQLQRVVRQASAEAPRQVVVREREQKAQARVRVQQAMERTRREPTKAQRAMVLDDHQHYQVLTPLQFRALAGNGFNSDGTVDVYGHGPSQALIRNGFHDVNSAVTQLEVNLQEMIESNEGPISFGYRTNRRPLFRQARLANAEDHDQLAERIRETFSSHPDVAQIYVEYRDQGVQVYGNQRPVDEQVVVEFDLDVDVTRPLRLVPIGRYRTGEMLYSDANAPGGLRDVGYGTDNPFNAPVMRYRAEELEDRIAAPTGYHNRLFRAP